MRRQQIIALVISALVSSFGLLMGLAALILVGYGVLMFANLIMIFTADEPVETPQVEKSIVIHSEDSLFSINNKI